MIEVVDLSSRIGTFRAAHRPVLEQLEQKTGIVAMALHPPQLKTEEQRMRLQSAKILLPAAQAGVRAATGLPRLVGSAPRRHIKQTQGDESELDRPLYAA